MRRRSEHDREIVLLALPALGALAAEPLYLLADTAIVGHLGTTQLAALALAGSVLAALVMLCNFLAYGVTAQVARMHGAGQEQQAGAVAAQALWLALAIGCATAAATAALASPVISLLGGEGDVHDQATTFLRIGALGLPCATIALAGQGYLRGVADLRTPLIVVVAANSLNVVLEVVFVYGFDWGLPGSAWGTVLAQLAMGASFAWLLLGAPSGALGRRPRWRLLRPLLRMGGALLVRTAALLGSLLVASAVVARIDPASLGAHQIGMQLFLFLTLVLDAIAIAGQVIVGRRLGAGDAAGARAAATRMVELSVAGGCALAVLLVVLGGLIPHVFTGDDAVVDHARELWPLLVLVQPIGAAAFALDGILMGAGETTFLARSMLASALVFVAFSLATLAFGWSVVGVWAGLVALMVVRVITCGARFRGGSWQVVGAWAPAST